MSSEVQDSPRESRLAARWRSPLLRLSLAALAFATASGSVLVFFGAYLPHRAPVGTMHWIAAAIAVPVWAGYLIRHYLRVRPGGRPIHFQVGLWTFFSLLFTSLTGVPLIFPEVLSGALTTVDMAHIFASFIVLILLAAHLMLVTRVAGPANGAPAIRGAVRTTLLWITLAATLGAIAGSIWLAR